MVSNFYWEVVCLFVLGVLLFSVEGPRMLDCEYFPPSIFAITFARVS